MTRTCTLVVADAAPWSENHRVELSDVLARAHDDPRARDSLVARFYPAVERQVHAKLEAERRRKSGGLAAMFSTGDLVHEVFLRVLQGVTTFEGGADEFERYLAKTVTHRLLDAIRYLEATRRHGPRLEDIEADEPASDVTSPNAAAARREEAAKVDEALAALTAKDRQLLELRMRKHATFAEIAEQAGMPSADAARKATHMAEARLLVALRARGIHR
ncbi:MAG: sigma-70 family RNA polymerase sigma factor [Planctomycetota bacterium]